MSKKIAPIIIVTLCVTYLAFILAGIMDIPLNFGLNMEMFFVVSGALIIGFLIISLIRTLVERLNEIDEEDHDDLSKY